MRNGKEKKYMLLKLLVGGIILFLIGIAFVDGTPKQTPVEKTVTYHAP